MAFAEVGFKVWSDCVVRVCGGMGLETTTVSLPLAGDWRTKGSRVTVMRIDEPEVRLE